MGSEANGRPRAPGAPVSTGDAGGSPAAGAGRRWVIAANRGPVELVRDESGQVERTRGSGGLVSALDALTRQLDDSVWICAARSDEDRAEVRRAPGGISDLDDGRRIVRMLDIDPETIEQYYSVVSNPIIWFVQHNLWDLSNAPNVTLTEREAFEKGYRKVNEAFADAIVRAIDEHPGPCTVMVHDYHLYLVGSLVRRKRPEVVLSHFVHIPWPQTEAWTILPGWMRQELLYGLAGNDLVAFQTERDVRNFLLTCEELLEAPIDRRARTVEIDGRTVMARWYPISVDAGQMEDLSRTEEVEHHLKAIENLRREHLVLRVDRTDLSKNILRGFLAYDRMLEKHPDLSGRVTFLALLQPSRQDVAEYAEYADRILRLVADINLKHGNVEWQPIDLRLENNLAQAVAAYMRFDVLLVNPVHDGLNLVAKEGMLLNERDGVLVLSEHAGVYEEIGAYAIGVHPVDIEQQADAIYEAMFMPPEDRRKRWEACVEVIRRHDLDHWFNMQLRDLQAIEGARVRS